MTVQVTLKRCWATAFALLALMAGTNAKEPQDESAQKLHLQLIEAAFDGDLVRLDRLAQQVGNWEVRHYRAFHFGARDIDRDRPSTANRGKSASVDTWTPLTAAILNKQIATATYLIGAGADVNTTTEYGYSPLLICVAHGKTDRPTKRLIALLLHKGADPHRRPEVVISPDDAKASAMEIAKGNKELWEVFQAAQAAGERE